jgi:hypothetical protein
VLKESIFGIFKLGTILLLYIINKMKTKMKNIKNIITIAAFLTIISAFSQTTYTWVGSNNSNWSTAANWSPLRINGQVTDILVFNCGGTINILNVQQQTVGQIKVSNNTRIVLNPASGNAKVISINGCEGTDLLIESGSALDITGNDPKLGIYVKAGATASISGSMSFRGNMAHYINSMDAGSIVFETGSVLSQQCPGNIFTSTGTANAVIFKSGAKFTLSNSSALTPFGLQVPESKVTFENGSTFVQNTSSSSSISFNGRRYSNFELSSNINLTVNENIESNITFNNFSIGNQSSLTLNSSSSADLIINGTLTLNNSTINSGNVTIRANGNVNRTTGYINGILVKPVTSENAEVTFEVGTSNGYSPVTLSFNNVESNGTVRVSAIQNFHPNVKDSTQIIKRYWRISGSSIEFDKFSASFKYLSSDFNNYFTENDESNMLVDCFGVNGTKTPYNSNVESRDTLNNVITVDNVTILGDFTNAKNLLIADNHTAAVNNTAKEFKLSQNYPNPFNPSTKIDYTVPFSSKISIKIFDMTGREISTLVNETKEAGSYTVNFNASSLSSGVYFYKLSAGSFEQTMKMVLVK